ncbi:hypothetical protein [Curtobacterium sp. MCBD17_032]|uniref:hypothetical protein n=1 Tax=Curtobacterium sp. MCBD17_032 TaxID=2175659 RepID=UPI000DA85F57|nr:hypothetical protein [Curtobacterium sp. MCBD17_032]PZE82475.1 hypothetical protein DEI91_11725 [Curtobacterium sp. MCBD17_032]
MLKERLRRLALPLVGATALAVALVAPAAPAMAGPAAHGKPYLIYTAFLVEKGSGTGYSSYINVHDAHNNALSVGIQSDTGSPESKGQPRFIWERVQNGKFTYGYMSAASHAKQAVGLRWYKNNVAAIMLKGKTVGTIDMKLQGRFFFNAEANARLNGDVVHSQVNDIAITVGDTPKNTGLVGKWNTNFSFHGLKARQTNSPKIQGANFVIDGRVTGLPRNGNWDTTEVAGIAMIAQRW